MGNGTPALVDGYEPLKEGVLRVLGKGKESVEQVIVQETLQTNFGIGRLLNRYLLAQQERVGYGSRRWRGRRRTWG